MTGECAICGAEGEVRLCVGCDMGFCCEHGEPGEKDSGVCDDCLEAACPEPDPPSVMRAREIAKVARAMLDLRGWTGGQLDLLHRAAAEMLKDEEECEIVEEMFESRAREEALRA